VPPDPPASWEWGKTAHLLVWLARHPRYHHPPRPTHPARRHASVVALVNDVRAWIENWNQNLKTFVSTKIAEDIL